MHKGVWWLPAKQIKDPKYNKRSLFRQTYFDIVFDGNTDP